MKNPFKTSVVLLCICCSSLVASDELADPFITAYANPYAGMATFDIGKMFDNDSGTTYATSVTVNNGWVHVPLSLDPADGTWAAFDFGQTADIDGIMYQNRASSSDWIYSMRLVFSTDATFDINDPTVNIDVIQDPNQNDYLFLPQTARYVLWEVTDTPDFAGYEGNNAGGAEMAFYGEIPEVELPDCLPVKGDLNRDCTVDILDIVKFFEQWLLSDCIDEYCADINWVDGVNLIDLAMLADNWQQTGSEIIISEFLARNIDTSVDDDGDSSDWIELLNLSPDVVSLAGWYLTDDDDNLTKWQIPDVTMPAGDYLTIYASGKDRVLTSDDLHTNFSLAADGEYLALVRPDGTVAHEYAPAYPLQEDDVSYGMIYDAEQFQFNEGYFLTPSFNAVNSFMVANLGPKIEHLAHLPLEPMQNEPVTVTAKVAQEVAAVSNVQLYYRVMYGSEVAVNMYDDGIHGDGSAGDGIYGGVIPAGVANPGDMLRYYIKAADIKGLQSRSPAALDLIGEDQSPEYFGTVVKGASTSTNLPILNWFVENTSAALTETGTRASLYFNGRFYDNIYVRIRGSAAISWPKHKFKFDFNRGNFFEFYPAYEPVEEFNLQSYYHEMLNSTTSSYMRENLAYDFLRDAEVPSCKTFHLYLNRNGQFYGLFSFVEQVDETYLRRHGYNPDGALYKSINCCGGTLQPLSMSSYPGYYLKAIQKDQPWNDLDEFTNGINVSNPDRFDFLMDNVDLPEVINYMAANCVMSNHDRLTKNFYAYREPETLLWHIFPWDLDQAFSYGKFLTEENWASPLYGNYDHTQDVVGGLPNPSWQNHIYTVMFDNPVTLEMYLRRVRTLMDKFLVNNSAYFVQKVNAYDALIHGEADIDSSMWGISDIDNGISEILNISLPTRRNYLLSETMIPTSLPSSFTVNFGQIEFNPAGGNQDQEYIELVNLNSFAVDISGWSLSGAVEFDFQPGTVIPSNTSLYVVPDVLAFLSRATSPKGGEGNFVQGNYKGHLSSWGETIVLSDETAAVVNSVTYTGNPSDQQKYLRISEIMYHPKQPEAGSEYVTEDFEYIELKNIGQDPLNLGGVKFTDGVAFEFPSQTQAGPINVSLIAIDDTWKYEQSDTDLGQMWREYDYDSSSWPEGAALLYYESSELPAPKNTLLTLGPTTYYFRKHFYLDADPAADTITLEINTVIDDGAVIYINGAEVFRIGMPTGEIDHSTFANRSPGNATYEGPFSVPAGSLRSGDNVIAVEVHQRSSSSSDVAFGMTLDASIIYSDSTVYTIAANDYALLVKNPTAFELRYPQAVDKIAGQYTGLLDNNGETIKLEDSTNSTILEFSYNDSWYNITDGEGFSLCVDDASDPNLLKWDQKEFWRPSALSGGSPGADDGNQLPDAGSIVVNEVLAHSDTLYDWIELYNTSSEPINIGGWFLSDNNDDDPNRMKYEIPQGTVIAANGYLVFYENLHFGNPVAAGCHTPFALSENGDDVYLQSGLDGVLTGYYEDESFGASQRDIAFGRYHKTSTDTYNFVAMSTNTPGAENAYPKVGPIVISEIMYNPPDGGTYDNDEYEFVELYNISGSTVTLQEYDGELGVTTAWTFTDGIDYTFPLGVTMAPNERLVIARNLNAFAERYGYSAGVYGPFENDTKLSNSGERLQIAMPGDTDASGTRYYIRIDRVTYSDGSHPTGEDPWPTTSDGDGDSLKRKVLTNYGNDPDNWQAQLPTPGT